ncbi:microfibrillar-associated protein 2 [Mixophyes fleayi]|uniref:microfibrillar-associated protein 2 n=1 Tax=Mixophyes fleayi TaxID=3061075 RepID=UPI003F4DE4C9
MVLGAVLLVMGDCQSSCPDLQNSSPHVHRISHCWMFNLTQMSSRLDVGICPLVRASERLQDTARETARLSQRDSQDPASHTLRAGTAQISVTMRSACFLLLCVHGILAQQQPYEPASQYDIPTESPYYYDYEDPSLGPQQPNQQIQTGFHVLTQPETHQSLDEFQYVPQQQQQTQQEIIPVPTFDTYQTEPTEPGPLDCREEQYPCTRLYSVHKPCKQCLQGICLYSLRRMYVINKEICVRIVCAHEELLRADLCRDKYPRCGVVASTGMCHSVGAQCSKSCGGC